jgi:hypothetical protein
LQGINSGVEAGWVSINSMKTYFIAVVVIVVELVAAWFVSGGEHFRDVALVCYGFVIG